MRTGKSIHSLLRPELRNLTHAALNSAQGRLTFDVSGGRRQAQPAGGCPPDEGFRRPRGAVDSPPHGLPRRRDHCTGDGQVRRGGISVARQEALCEGEVLRRANNVTMKRERVARNGQRQELHGQLEGNDHLGIVVPETGKDERSVEPRGNDAAVDGIGTATALKAIVELGEPDDRASRLVKRTSEAEPQDFPSVVELTQLDVALLGAQAERYGWTLHAWEK